MLKKILIIFILILNILTINCFADDIELENFPEEEIWEDVKNVDATINENPPQLNSRAAIIYDRTSKTVIYG